MIFAPLLALLCKSNLGKRRLKEGYQCSSLCRHRCSWLTIPVTSIPGNRVSTPSSHSWRSARCDSQYNGCVRDCKEATTTFRWVQRRGSRAGDAVYRERAAPAHDGGRSSQRRAAVDAQSRCINGQRALVALACFKLQVVCHTTPRSPESHRGSRWSEPKRMRISTTPRCAHFPTLHDLYSICPGADHDSMPTHLETTSSSV